MRSLYKEREFAQQCGAYFPKARLAEAWTPYQHLCMTFDPAVGLHYGTIFPELVRPYEPHPSGPELY